MRRLFSPFLIVACVAAGGLVGCEEFFDVNVTAPPAESPTPEPEPPPEPEPEPAPRQEISVNLSCIEVAGQALTAQCTARASSNGKWASWQWGDGQSDGARRQLTRVHTYRVADTYTVDVEVCEFEVPDEFCGNDNAPVTVQ